MATTLAHIQQRRKTAAAWTSSNEVLLAGEIGAETDTPKWKLGDGSTAWTSLAYQPSNSSVAAAIASQATTTASTYATKTAITVTPKMYGAVGDGVTDDYTAFAAMLAALPVGGNVDLAGATYYLGTTPNTLNRMSMANGALTTTNRRVLIVSGADTEFRNVRFSRTGSSTGSDDGNGVFIQAARFRSHNCDYANSFGAPLALRNGFCNNSTIQGGYVSLTSARNQAGIYVLAGATENLNVTIRGVTIDGSGASGGSGISINDASQSLISGNYIDGFSKMPTVTLTTWTSLGGNIWRATDRTDSATRILRVNTVELGETTTTPTTPISNQWGISGGFVYLNDTTDPNTQTITSDLPSGYGVNLYNTGSGASINMHDNLIEGNHITNTAGFGIYFQLGGDKPLAVNNVSRNNHLANVCTAGVQTGFLAFAGIAFSAGNDSMSQGDVITNVGVSGSPAPGIRFNPNITSGTTSGRVVGTRITNAYGLGVQMCPGDIILSACVITGCGQSGVGFANLTGSSVGNFELNDCTMTGNAVHGVTAGFQAGSNMRISIVGGKYADNASRGISIQAARDSKIVGAYVGNNPSGNIQLYGSCVRTSVDDVVIGQGSSSYGISVDNTCSSMSVGSFSSIITPGLTIAVPVCVSGAWGGVGTFMYTGSPEGVVTAAIGSRYIRTDGGAGTSSYVKESGTSNTGWVAK